MTSVEVEAVNDVDDVNDVNDVNDVDAVDPVDPVDPVDVVDVVASMLTLSLTLLNQKYLLMQFKKRITTNINQGSPTLLHRCTSFY